MASAEPSLTASDAPKPVKPAALARRGARPYSILGAIVLVALAGYGAFRVLSAGRENTDDAQVGTDMLPIAARVAGTVLKLNVVDHQAVKQGELIAEIDPRDYQNKLDQARAELEAARAEAESADAQTRIVAAGSRGNLSTAQAALSGSAASVAGAGAQIEAAKAAVTRAEAESQKADGDLARAQSLRKDDAIPQAQLDTQLAAASAARAALSQAKAMLAVAEEAKRSATARTAEARGRVEQSATVDAELAAAKARAELAHAHVASAEAKLAQAELDLSYTRIVAPAAGHVSKLAVHPGQLLAASQTITNLLPLETYVVANFKETQVGSLHRGQSAEIALDAYPGRSFRAKVDSIAYGTGAQFSLLPPDNASGNFVKVVQRVPVKLTWLELPSDVRFEAGLSADVTVFTR